MAANYQTSFFCQALLADCTLVPYTHTSWLIKTAPESLPLFNVVISFEIFLLNFLLNFLGLQLFNLCPQLRRQARGRWRFLIWFRKILTRLPDPYSDTVRATSPLFGKIRGRNSVFNTFLDDLLSLVRCQTPCPRCCVRGRR